MPKTTTADQSAGSVSNAPTPRQIGCYVTCACKCGKSMCGCREVPPAAIHEPTARQREWGALVGGGYTHA